MTSAIKAQPIRIIPFDLGRALCLADIDSIEAYIEEKYALPNTSLRQQTILKECSCIFSINNHVNVYVYETGMAVVSIKEPHIEFSEDYTAFAITYGKNRKESHGQLFAWQHCDSPAIRTVIDDLRSIVAKNTDRKDTIRQSAKNSFEYMGLSYIMTLSIIEVPLDVVHTINNFLNYPVWLKNNIFALLDPSLVYLEDSGKFEATKENPDIPNTIDKLEMAEIPKDYERHRHIAAFMSWAAVLVVGQVQSVDIEEYCTLEVQLQSDWFYVYCLEQGLGKHMRLSKREIVKIQKQSYELDLLENRLFDFNDSSVPARIQNIQKGLVETSGLDNRIQHLKRKMQYILDRERLNLEIRQKKIGQSSEILLFFIAFIQIAPTVAAFGNSIFPYLGIFVNCILALLGLILLIRKE